MRTIFLRRMNEIDSTGARILLDTQTDLKRMGASLALVLSKRSDFMLRLRDFGVLEQVFVDQIFEDVD